MLFAGQPASPGRGDGDGDGLGVGFSVGVGVGVGVGAGVAGACVAGASVGAAVGASVGVAVGVGLGVGDAVGVAAAGAAVVGAAVGACVAVGVGVACALNATYVACACVVSSVVRQRASVPALSAAACGVRPSFATKSLTSCTLSALQSCGLSFAKLEVHALPMSRTATTAAPRRRRFIRSSSLTHRGLNAVRRLALRGPQSR